MDDFGGLCPFALLGDRTVSPVGALLGDHTVSPVDVITLPLKRRTSPYAAFLVCTSQPPEPSAPYSAILCNLRGVGYCVTTTENGLKHP